MIYIGLYVCGAMVSAADTSVEDTAAAASVENNDDETAETADANDPFRIKRQHGQGGHSALSGILSSVFNKKLGLIGSLSSISSSSKGVETHHHTYDYSVNLIVIINKIMLILLDRSSKHLFFF